MNYKLNPEKTEPRAKGILSAISVLTPLLLTERKRLLFALTAIIANAGLTLVAPLLIGFTIDRHVTAGNYAGVLLFSGILLFVYVGALITSYLQTSLMGKVGQHVLFSVRNSIFEKLQSLPIAFFNQNKSGDLISRINNDTEKLNQFLSQSLVQFASGFFVILGSGIFLISIDPRLGAVAIAPAVLVLLFSRIISPWMRARNTKSLGSLGALSSEIQEGIENFKVIVAFNRRDYFRQRFAEVNEKNYKDAVKAGVANMVFQPVYGLASNLAQLGTLTVGVYFISRGSFTIGLLISFVAYSTTLYNQLRQIAAVWTNFQVAMSGWDRISDILSLQNNLATIEVPAQNHSGGVLSFDAVGFQYSDGTRVLRSVSFSLEAGKTYALVGPTGGGKTTTASLMARLFDPSEGTVFLHGKDIRGYSPEERTSKIGFILQEPFLFAGTVKENIVYGMDEYVQLDTDAVHELLREAGLDSLLVRFEKGLDTPISLAGDAISLGQKQLIAFMRAVLRKPDLLILDEATANVDTVTEELLQKILDALPKQTTRVVIAHRLHTIANADQIFFVNGGEIKNAGSMEHALSMLMHGKKSS